MGIGKTLSNILEENNSNPNELSERTGIPPSTIYSIIKRDNMKVDISVLARICKELGVEMNRFYDEYFDEIKNTSFEETDKVLLTQRQNKIINLFSKLTEAQQDNLIGRAELFVEQNEQEKKQKQTSNDQMHMVYKIARSSSGKQAEKIEVSQEEFDRLENAPETDEDFS